MRTQRTALVSALLATMVLLAGCSAGGAATTTDQYGGAPASGADAPPMTGEEAVVESDGSIAAQPYAAETDREVIVTGSMTVTAEDPSAAARDAVRIVETAGGRVDARSEYAPSGGDFGSANLTLRIPADKLQAVIDDLAALGADGTADEVSTYTQDVTVQVADLESRIATQRGIIERLNGLFGTATSIDDLIALETNLAQHQSELESLEAQQRSTDDQVALSTLDLYLRSEAEAPVEQPLDFVTGLQAGWGAFVGFFSGLLVALGVLLPWLVTIGLVTVAVIAIVRRRRSRAAAKA